MRKHVKAIAAIMLTTCVMMMSGCKPDDDPSNGGNESPVPLVLTGAINGLFSVSASQQVYFSQGNLQYRASTNTWRFAFNQWEDYVGADNANASKTYFGWIDLFGWGTSENVSYYYAYGQSTYNLYDQTGKADWGYNAISNGGRGAWSVDFGDAYLDSGSYYHRYFGLSVRLVRFLQ